MPDSERVLIVEDEHIVQLHLRSLVKEMGYAVSGVAASAEEALARAAETPPSLVLMDIRLSGGSDGIAAAKALRDLCDPALVFLTAFGDAETLGRAQEAGAAGYLIKPFTRPQLHATLSTALREHARQRHLRHGESSLAALLADTHSAIIACNRDGLVTSISAEAVHLTGWSEEQARGRPAFEVLRFSGVADAREFDGLLELARGGQKGALRGMSLFSRDEREHPIEGEIKPLRDTAGGHGGAVFVLRAAGTPLAAAARRSTRERRPFGAPGEPTRMVIFSHDTLGLGHLQRNLKIARALTARFDNLSVLVLTGSSAVHRFPMPERVDYVKLPSVKKVASEVYAARSLGVSNADVLTLRSNLALRAIQDFDPHVLLADHAPTGMGGELLPALEWLQRSRPDCTKLIGLRDILDEPESVVALWRESGVYDVLERLYDHALIYGAREVYDPTTAYAFPPRLAEKTLFLGYVRPSETAADAQIDVPEARSGRPFVVVTIGGGDGAGEEVIGGYLQMLRAQRERLRFDSIVLTGPFLEPRLLERFRADVQGLPARLQEFVPSTRPFLSQAALVVATGGYNTVTETLCWARRTILIPRVLHRQEQLLRARRLADLGLVAVMHPDDATPDALFSAVTAALESPLEPLAEARATARLPFDGTARLAEFCAALTVQ